MIFAVKLLLQGSNFNDTICIIGLFISYGLSQYFCFAKLSIQLQGQCFTLEQYSLIRLFVKDYHVVKRILFN